MATCEEVDPGVSARLAPCRLRWQRPEAPGRIDAHAPDGTSVAKQKVWVVAGHGTNAYRTVSAARHDQLSRRVPGHQGYLVAMTREGPATCLLEVVNGCGAHRKADICRVQDQHASSVRAEERDSRRRAQPLR